MEQGERDKTEIDGEKQRCVVVAMSEIERERSMLYSY